MSKDGQERILENFKGSAQGGINQTFAPNTEVPLAPLAEQRRIVAKLETLLGKVDTCQQRLARIPVLLKRFRQSILAAACSGRLTADWRESREHVVSEMIEADPPQGVYSISSDAELEALPIGWRWIPIGNLSDFQQGMQIAKNTRLKEPGPNRLPILRTFNYANRFSEDVEYIELTDESLIAEATDIILSRTGTIGRVLTGVRGVFHNNSFRLNYDKRLLDRGYLICWLEGPSVQSLIKIVSGRSAQPDLTHKAFGPFPLPLLSLAEQQEIVRRVEALFAVADQIEARYAKAKAHIDKLTPSLLARAFRGELVPQDPNDEPASVLLERIKQINANDQPKRKTTRATRARV
jgi:type I restriction enzyme, S subunit